MKEKPEIYKYETHCHTSPVSKCGRAAVADTVCFYKQFGYDGIFITNHFLDGNINPRARRFYHDLLGLDMLVELDGNMIEVGTPKTELQQ